MTLLQTTTETESARTTQPGSTEFVQFADRVEAIANPDHPDHEAITAEHIAREGIERHFAAVDERNERVGIAPDADAVADKKGEAEWDNIQPVVNLDTQVPETPEPTTSPVVLEPRTSTTLPPTTTPASNLFTLPPIR